jgi:uncharacterized protein (TIGR01440 family)
MVDIKEKVFRAMNELLDEAGLAGGDIVVLGCSTSEICGKKIGKGSAYEVGKNVVASVLAATKPRGVYLAVGCCEHLNRAVVIERAAAEKYNLEIVSVVPMPNAGGSAGAAAYRLFDDPCVVEFVSAHAGMDIGDTLIGMHLRHVAVPLRLSIDTIGKAHVTYAKTRPKFIGGARAVYKLPEE